MEKTKKIVTGSNLLILGVLVVLALMFFYFTGKDQIVKAERLDESGITISVSQSLAQQILGLFAGILGSDDSFGGTTNLDTLELSEDFGVTGATVVDEFTQGGSVLATSTSATATVLATSDLLTYSTWEVTPNVADLTYTFPASSTMSTLVPTAGDSRTWMIYNATTTAAIDVIFAAGSAGTEIKGAGGAALTIDEASFGTITLTRKANSDILILTNFPTAD